MAGTLVPRRLGALVVAVALAAGFATVVGTRAAHAAGPNVLFIQAEGSSYSADVVAGLDATGAVGTITNFDASVATPTPADLSGIDVVLVSSDDNFAAPDALGDLLADFVDGGGRVVQMTFALECPGELGIGGRWLSENYGAFDVSVCDQIDHDGPLGFTTVDAGSPLLAGVTSFNGGTSSYRNDVALASGATLVANWDDEGVTPFEAWTAAHAGCVVGLNFYPPSSNARGDFWDATTDGWILQANALNFTCGATPVTPVVPEAPVVAPVVLAPAFTG